MDCEPKRYIPANKRRALRQEACFCCPICGCPILVYHHIIPWADIKEHLNEHMIPLCPTCHSLADNEAYSKSFLYEIKQAGKGSPGWKHSIRFPSDDFYLQVGNIKFEKPKEILQIDNSPILSIERSSEDNLILNTLFYDDSRRLLLSVLDNELTINTKYFWDIEYNGKLLTVKKRPRQVMFQIEIHSEHIWLIKGIYHFGTSKVEFFHKGFSVSTGKTFFKSVDEKVTFSHGNGIRVFSEG